MHKLSLMLAAAALLTACSGGSDGAGAPPAPPPAPAPADPPVAGTAVPTSATTSSTGATVFVRTATTLSSDAAEPLELGTAMLATSDTDEPSD
jgi:hypothetical protein